jgi:uncharacterized protein (TIGR03435 family)
MRVVIAGLWLLSAAAMSAQPAFEVASIKPTAGREVNGSYTYPGGKVTFRGCTLEYLIQLAFNLQQFQMSGGPGWMKTDRFDIDAKPPESSASSKSAPPYEKAPMNEEQRQMLQTLLVERFQLHYRRETREGPIYLLVKGNKPITMTEAKDKNAYPWARVIQTGMVGTNENMPDLAWRLAREIGKPVIDRTGITGSYDFQASYTPGDGPDDYVAVAIATVRELGLKLETSKGPVETIVIESAERPSAN